MSDIEELLDRFRRGAELMAVTMTGAAGPELDYAASAGKWTIRQIVCHVSDAELVGACRFRRVIAEDAPTLMAYDQDSWTANLDYGRRKTSHALETFRRIRAENHDLLKELPPAAFDRTGNHSERGPLTLRQLVEMYAEHAESHARQIREIRAAYKASRAS
jgi:hypothetical protein